MWFAIAVIKTHKKQTTTETPNSARTASQRKPRRKACTVAAGVAQECLVRKGSALLSFDQEFAAASTHFRKPQIVTCFCLLHENHYKYFQKPDVVIRSCFSQRNTQNTPKKSQRMLCVVAFFFIWESNYNTSYEA